MTGEPTHNHATDTDPPVSILHFAPYQLPLINGSAKRLRHVAKVLLVFLHCHDLALHESRIHFVDGGNFSLGQKLGQRQIACTYR
jgi:hypothetical protein